MRRLDGYLLVEQFWTEVLAQQAGRELRVIFPISGHIGVRDPLPYAVVYHHLYGRERVTLHHAPAWHFDENMRGLAAHEDVFVIGRARMLTGTRLARFSHQWELGMKGRFIDPIDGRLGDEIAYDEHVYKAEHIDSGDAFDVCKVDFGVLTWRRESIGNATRLVVCAAGLGAFGTFALSYLLSSQQRRFELAEKIRRVARPQQQQRPDLGMEILIKAAVTDPHEFRMLLDRATNPGGPAPFRFSVEAVAVRNSVMQWETTIAENPVCEIDLATPRELRRVRCLATEKDVEVPKMSYELLRYLAEAPDHRATPAKLRKGLGCDDGRRGHNRLKGRIDGAHAFFERQFGKPLINYNPSDKYYGLDSVRVVQSR